MFNLFKEFYRKKALQGAKRVEKPVFLNFKDIGSLGFVCCADNSVELEEVMQLAEYLKGQKMPFKGVVIVPKNLQATFEENILLLQGNDLNWYGLVDKQKLDSFFNKQFDLFVTFNLHKDFTLDFISVNVNSKMCVAMSADSYVPQSMVVEPGEKDITILEYLKHLFNYLKTINKEIDGE